MENSSNYSASAKKAYENFENIVTNYGSIIEKTNNGGIPESIYTLVTNCTKELARLKSEAGSQDKLYKDASSKIIRLSIDLLIDWTRANYHLLFFQIQGMSLGKTLFDVCYLTVLEIDKIETDSVTKELFNLKANEIIYLKYNHEMDILKKRFNIKS
jgi:hypothetical protein